LAAAISARHSATIRWPTSARIDIDPDARLVRVSRQLTQLRGLGLTFGVPKTEAGRRIVTTPEVIISELCWHLGRFATEADDGLLFTSVDGTPLRHSNFPQSCLAQRCRAFRDINGTLIFFTVTACTLQGMARVRSGQACPCPWFLTGGGAKAPRSRAGPEDAFCEAVRKDLQVPLTVEGHPRTLSGPSPAASPAGILHLATAIALAAIAGRAGPLLPPDRCSPP
jgi:hypothetical protein